MIFAFGVTFLAPLLGRLVVKDDVAVEDDARLSDEQMAAFELALRTGVLPVASLFADWGPALNKRRRDLKSGRWLIPILMVGIVGLSIYDSFVDPDGAWFYGISALFYAVIAVKVKPAHDRDCDRSRRSSISSTPAAAVFPVTANQRPVIASANPVAEHWQANPAARSNRYCENDTSIRMKGRVPGLWTARVRRILGHLNAPTFWVPEGKHGLDLSNCAVNGSP
ncbi:hypothetical protein [Arthrobacter sp. NPDC093139]|uniref:hypothetical protein n=1 Tax=Arthrobacter sp. NPDC093139 TaxID=3363945 RepID=UPI0037FC8951